ncbi:hypothetical protein DMUE_3590, partial [Dictyocoela muelleri]
DHWHENENPRIIKHRINNTLKRKAFDTNEPFDASLLTAMNNIEGLEKNKLSKFDSLRGYFCRIRNTNNIKMINNDNEILDIYRFTLDNNQLLQFDSGYKNEDRIIIFSTNYNLRILFNSKIWLCDGTFFVSPQ